MQDHETRLQLFRDMAQCCHNFSFCSFDTQLHSLHQSPQDDVFYTGLWTMMQTRETMLRHALSSPKPLILTGYFRLVWASVPEYEDGALTRVHALGPFFADDVSMNDLIDEIRRLDLSMSVRQEFLRRLRELPVLSLGRMFEYVMMMHLCVTGERISPSDFTYHSQEDRLPVGTDSDENTRDHSHGTYEAEQEMLRLVREGDLNYKKHMGRLAVTGSQGKLSNGEQLRQLKNAVLVCITLFSRASIEGGLDPEISFTLADKYFQGVEACKSITELSQISATMQDDFVTRVHRIRTDTSLSKPIHTCCELIRLRLEEDISIQELAKGLGYTHYYLSRKFKREVGLAPSDYIRRERLERARFLLRTTTLAVQEIGDQLRFCSQSYFADVFRRAYGVTPSEWREDGEA